MADVSQVTVTPRPWTRRAPNHYNRGRDNWHITGPDGRSLATVGTEADARLIVQRVNGYQALMAALTALADDAQELACCWADTMPRSASRVEALERQARAALQVAGQEDTP